MDTINIEFYYRKKNAYTLHFSVEKYILSDIDIKNIIFYIKV